MLVVRSCDTIADWEDETSAIAFPIPFVVRLSGPLFVLLVRVVRVWVEEGIDGNDDDDAKEWLSSLCFPCLS